MKSFNKAQLQAKINTDLRSSQLRPIGEILFEQVDNWTTCLIVGYLYSGANNTTRQYIYGLGSAKRNPADELDPDVGKRYALTRAVQSYVNRQRELGVRLQPRKPRSKRSQNDEITLANELAAAEAREIAVNAPLEGQALIATHLPDAMPPAELFEQTGA